MEWDNRKSLAFVFIVMLCCYQGYCFCSLSVSFIPLVRELVSFGVMILNFSLAASLSLFVIALGWLRYRPALSLTLLAIGAMPYIIAKLSQKKSDDSEKHT